MTPIYPKPHSSSSTNVYPQPVLWRILEIGILFYTIQDSESVGRNSEIKELGINLIPLLQLKLSRPSYVLLFHPQTLPNSLTVKSHDRKNPKECREVWCRLYVYILVLFTVSSLLYSLLSLVKSRLTASLQDKHFQRFSQPSFPLAFRLRIRPTLNLPNVQSPHTPRHLPPCRRIAIGYYRDSSC